MNKKKPAATATITAKSGHQPDVAAAIAEANPGDNVLIPQGTWNWDTGVWIDKALTLKSAGAAGSSVISRSGGTWSMIGIGPSSDVPVTIDGLYFQNNFIGQASGSMSSIDIYGPGGGFGGDNTKGLTQILIQNCTIHGGYNSIYWHNFAYGCIKNCLWLNCGYGLVFYSDSDANQDWRRPLDFGSPNQVYVEDCIVRMDGHMTYADTFHDENRGGRIVFRKTVFDYADMPQAAQPGSILMTHGNTQYCWHDDDDFDKSWRGPVSMELYDCDFILPTSVALYRIIYIRGGRGIIANNKFTMNASSGYALVHFTEEEAYHNVAFAAGPNNTGAWRTSWPAEDQVNNFFIWGNVLDGRAQQSSDFGYWNGTDPTFIQEGRDYWLKEPGADTVTHYPQPAPPSLAHYPVGTFYQPATQFSPLAYPHPLVNGAPVPPEPEPPIPPEPGSKELLICEPYPANADPKLDVVSFKVNFSLAGWNPWSQPASVGPSGEQYFSYDLTTNTSYTDEPYTAQVEAVNGYGLVSPAGVYSSSGDNPPPGPSAPSAPVLKVVKRPAPAKKK